MDSRPAGQSLFDYHVLESPHKNCQLKLAKPQKVEDCNGFKPLTSRVASHIVR